MNTKKGLEQKIEAAEKEMIALLKEVAKTAPRASQQFYGIKSVSTSFKSAFLSMKQLLVTEETAWDTDILPDEQEQPNQ